ncbi:DNA replication/repair protein RecF [Erythrobacteraceae bacterium CFH 75059]|uniref:DNA replication/repair protein RecF n=1 Tax=Qipengyuania thermophila TaxID=2509361 RepID=UPI0010217E59|nr:DNA replication/repair protein RecF [Qipengyuania thermophila]TCD06353.1 DNA replication/repair protein RecF [Erythrobacteraceae bacterium CFH 75059]
MAIRSVSLRTFRNHRDTVLDKSGHINLLLGRNGAGKTNILEALSLLAPGRGLRRAAPADLPLAGAGDFAVGVGVATAAGEVRLGTHTLPGQGGRRFARINGAPATLTTLAEWLSLAWLTPAMDGLFTGPASGRRLYLDRLTVACDPRHAAHATRYAAALRERNRLLAAGGGADDPRWLDAVERLLAEHGAALSRGRKGLVDALAGRMEAERDALFMPPALHYRAGGPTEAGALLDALQAGRRSDAAAGRTLLGPHRDELEVRHASRDMAAAQCSTGEQKAMLIAMTLAHAQLAAGSRPAVLLLDEVAAHLDPERRAALFARLRSGAAQVWLTGTDAAPFSALGQDAAVWLVEEGKARPA